MKRIIYLVIVFGFIHVCNTSAQDEITYLNPKGFKASVEEAIIEANGRPELWFHDIFRNDGTPYKKEETDFKKEDYQ